MITNTLVVILLAVTFSAHSKVLFIADSHGVGPFGKKFDSLLRESNSEVITHASCGAIGKWFRTGQKTKCGYFFRDQEGKIESGKSANTPIIDKTLSKFSPEIVIIEMGGNYTHRSDSSSIEDIDQLVTLIINSGSKCLWIGTPSSRDNSRVPRLYRLIRSGVKGRCPIFDSSKVTKYPKNPRLDGIHYWGKEGIIQAENWAKKAILYYESQI